MDSTSHWKEGIESSEIEEAARYVYANEFIEKLPEKFDFQLLENGKNLSEGEARLDCVCQGYCRQIRSFCLG